jgi:hypothetical protein
MPVAKPNSRFRFTTGLTGSLDINVLLSFVFGVLFLAVMLIFSVLYPNPTASQIRIWITALALSAAGVGAVLPGFLEVKYKSIVRATGALGLFVIVYLFQPAIERSVPSFPEPTQDPAPIATSFLTLLDQGNTAAAYAMFDPDAKQSVSLETFQSMYQSVRAPERAAKTRTLAGVQNELNPSGAPPGRYRIFSYITKFANDCRIEAVGLKANQSLTWSISSYNISLAAVPCTTTQ